MSREGRSYTSPDLMVVFFSGVTYPLVRSFGSPGQALKRVLLLQEALHTSATKSKATVPGIGRTAAMTGSAGEVGVGLGGRGVGGG